MRWGRVAFRTATLWTPSFVVTVGLLAILELAIGAGLLDAQYLPPPSDVFGALRDRLGGHHLAADVWHTLSGWGLGLGLAAALAVPLGMLIGSSSILYRGTRGLIELMRPIPSVALVPLLVLTLGGDMEAEVVLVAFASFWPILVQTIYGFRDLDPELIESARSLGFGRASLLVRVSMPGALPYVATGLRIASAIALVLAVTAELVIGIPGLGQSIALTQAGGAVSAMYALIIVTGLLGWGLNALFLALERRLLRWHVAYRPRGA